MVLQLGEDLLDRIEVGTVREQVDEFGVVVSRKWWKLVGGVISG